MDIRFHFKKLFWILSHYRLIRFSTNYLSNHFSGPITYDADGLVTSNNADFVNEGRFRKAYDASKNTNPWPGFTLQWRVYIVCWFANHVKLLEGDYVECGVNTGAYARAVIEYIDFNNTGKLFYLLDTFEGFPVEQISEEEKRKGLDFYGGSHYKDVYDQVVETFRPFRVSIIKGRVPETLSLCKAEKIAYLSIDMNAVAPEIAAAEYFWDRIVDGGVILLDDYGFPMHTEQKLAFDDFAKRKKIEILSLPTGQGVIIKK